MDEMFLVARSLDTAVHAARSAGRTMSRVARVETSTDTECRLVIAPRKAFLAFLRVVDWIVCPVLTFLDDAMGRDDPRELRVRLVGDGGTTQVTVHGPESQTRQFVTRLQQALR